MTIHKGKRKIFMRRFISMKEEKYTCIFKYESENMLC